MTKAFFELGYVMQDRHRMERQSEGAHVGEGCLTEGIYKYVQKLWCVEKFLCYSIYCFVGKDISNKHKGIEAKLLFFSQDQPATVLTASSKKKLKNVGVFLKVGQLM